MRKQTDNIQLQNGDNMTVEEWQGTEDSGWKRCNACYGVFQSGDNVQKCCRNYDSPEYYTDCIGGN